jgi:hypothetical protein
MTAALAAAKEGYMYDDPSDRKGVEYPRLRYPVTYIKQITAHA